MYDIFTAPPMQVIEDLDAQRVLREEIERQHLPRPPMEKTKFGKAPRQPPSAIERLAQYASHPAAVERRLLHTWPWQQR